MERAILNISVPIETINKTFAVVKYRSKLIGGVKQPCLSTFIYRPNPFARKPQFRIRP